MICRVDRVRLLQSDKKQLQTRLFVFVGGEFAHVALHGARHFFGARLHGPQKLHGMRRQVSLAFVACASRLFFSATWNSF